MNQTNLIFTRYLYVKEEVELALLASILCKSDDALFWAYELFYSGFKNETFALLLKIYYDFFATLNPALESYLVKKQKDWSKCTDASEDCTIGSIVQTMLFRPFNTDVFFLRQICSCFEVDVEYCSTIITVDELEQNARTWMNTKDYRSIAEWILNQNKGHFELKTVYEVFLREIKLTNGKSKEWKYSVLSNVDANVVLLAKVIELFSRKEKLKKGISSYMPMEPEDVVIYEDLTSQQFPVYYTILRKAYICGIDDLKHLGLFKLNREKFNLKESYWYKWEYYASFSPVWLQRILKFGGTIDHEKKKVQFEEDPDDELMQTFYDRYCLNPDEQLECVQNKSIMPIEKKHNWTWFYQTYRNNGLLDVADEELAEFNTDKIKY